MIPPNPRPDEFQLRLAHYLLDQLRSHGEFETVAQHFRLLIAQTLDQSLGELYAHIGRLVLDRMSQSQLENYNDDVQLFPPRVAFVHEHIFRLCIGSLSAENIIEPSSTWYNNKSATEFSATPESNDKEISVEKNSELLFHLYNFRLISLAQISEYIFRVIKSHGASVGTRLTDAAAGVRLLTKLFPGHSRGPWKKEVNSFSRWADTHLGSDEGGAQTIVDSTSHDQKPPDITAEGDMGRKSSPTLSGNGRKTLPFNSFNAPVGPNNRVNSFGRPYPEEEESNATGNNLGKPLQTPSTSPSLDPTSGLSSPPSGDASTLEDQAPSSLKSTSLPAGKQKNEWLTKAQKEKGKVVGKEEREIIEREKFEEEKQTEGEAEPKKREQAECKAKEEAERKAREEREAREEARKAEEQVRKKARVDKIPEEENGGKRSKQAERRAKKTAERQAKKEAKCKAREGVEDVALSRPEKTQAGGEAKEVHLNSMSRDASQGDVGGGGTLEAERTRSQRGCHYADSVSASRLQTRPSQTTNLEPVTPLRPTSGRWVARSRIRIFRRMEERWLVDRKVKALLNKLTMEGFDSISDQIIEWANKSEQETDGSTLMQVIKLVFEKAKDEAAFSEMYARLCRKMIERVSPYVQDKTIHNSEGRPITGGMLFRKYLLNRCQEDFERGWSAKEAALATAATKAGEGEAAEAASEGNGELVLYSDEYYAAAKARREGLGLVRFICELFKLQILTERIMHECIKKLLSNVVSPKEEEIESLCELLTTVGQNLDNPKARNHMDIYFERMQEIAKGSNTNSRMQFKLLDVIELRARNWQARSAVPRSQLMRQYSSHNDSGQRGEHRGVNGTERDSWYTVISMFLKYY